MNNIFEANLQWSVECPFLNTNWFSVVSRYGVKSSSNIISNVIETVVTTIISLYLFTLLVSQSGLSCESQLIETVRDWITAIDNKTQIDAILFDFAKAFEKVPHKRLLSKLAFYGITGNTQKLDKIISFTPKTEFQSTAPCRIIHVLHQEYHRAQS